jgi:hypothetical protein
MHSCSLLKYVAASLNRNVTYVANQHWQVINTGATVVLCLCKVAALSRRSFINMC